MSSNLEESFLKMLSIISLTKHHLFKLSLIGVFSFLQACSGSLELRDPLVEFHQNSILSSKKMMSSDSLFRAGNLILFGDILIVKDDELDFLYKLIDVNKDQFLKKFGKIGPGPCELDPSGVSFRLGPNGDRIGVFEMQTREYQEFQFKQILDSEEEPVCHQFSEKFASDIRLAIKIEENLFLVAPAGQKPYGLFRGNTLVKTIGEFPFRDQHEGIDPIIMDLAFQNRLIKHPSRPLILGTSSFSFNMEIFELKNDKNLIIKKSLHYWPPQFEPSNELNQFYASIKEENRFGNVSTAVSENFIYVLYSDEPWKYQFPIKSKRVLVYDWDGNPVKILELNQEVSIIVAHENDDYLIGYVDDGKANLFLFNMK